MSFSIWGSSVIFNFYILNTFVLFLKSSDYSLDLFPHTLPCSYLLTDDVIPVYSSELILVWRTSKTQRVDFCPAFGMNPKTTWTKSGNNYLRCVENEDRMNFSQSRTNTLCTVAHCLNTLCESSTIGKLPVCFHNLHCCLENKLQGNWITTDKKKNELDW